jgi:hypothetical protein
MKAGRVLRQSSYSRHGDTVEFWFNLKTLKVEVGPKVAAAYRVGPFNSEEDAKNALELIRERSRSWSDEEAESQE